MSNDAEAFYNNLLQFCESLIIDFYNKFMLERLSNTLTVSNNTTEDADDSSATITIPDDKLVGCIRRGLRYIKIFLKQLQDEDEGILSTGINIEAWKMTNITVNIIAQQVKLHRLSNFIIEEVRCRVAEGVVYLKIKWPNAYLSESGVFNGIMHNGKQISGYGNFKVMVTNVTIGIHLNFTDKAEVYEIADFKLIPDFGDVKVTVTGLKVEDGGNAEEIINRAIQRDKIKFKETLLTNALTISEQIKIVLNEKLRAMSKHAVARMITSWSELLKF